MGKNTLLNFFTFLWTVQLAPIRNDCLAHLSPQSVFQTFITVFFQRTVVESRTFFSISEINTSQSYTSLNAIAVTNYLCYHQEMALDSAGFTQR